VTVIGDLITRAERERLLERLDELEDTDRVMRRPGSLAAPAEPIPLHRAARGEAP
jgi:hypothetical protein